MPSSATPRYRGGLSRGLSKNTFLLAFASLFADISTEMLYPVLPVFLTQTLKASGSIVGLVDGFAGRAEYRAGLLRLTFGQAAKAKRHRAGRLFQGGARQAAYGAFHLARSSAHGCWTGLARVRVPCRGTRSSRPQWTRKIEAEPSGLRALATMRARSSGRC